jgi:hypothetical protein
MIAAFYKIIYICTLFIIILNKNKECGYLR